MKADRLHKLLDDLANEYTTTETDQRVAKVEEALSAVVSSQTEDTAVAFRRALATLEEQLSSVPSNNLPPSYLHMLNEIGLREDYGAGLRNRIRQVINSSNMVPATALASIQGIRVSLRDSHKIVASTVKAFERFSVPMEELEPGDFEFGYLRPDESTDGKFESFTKEINELNLLVRTFQELAGEDVNGATVNGVSACDWSVYVGMAPVAAAGLATAIERIVALYKSHLEIKTLRRQLSDRVPQLDELVQSAIEKHVSEGMTQVVTAVMERFESSGDQSRRNELENQLTMRLRWLAKRMENHTLVEVRAEPLDGIEISAEEEDSDNPEEVLMYVDEHLISLVGQVNATTSAVLAMDAEPGEQVFAELPVDPQSDSKSPKDSNASPE